MAAILVLTAVVAAAKTGGVLWVRLFRPLLSANTASMAVAFLGGQQLRAPLVPPADSPLPATLPSAVLVACFAGLVGLLGSALFQPLHMVLSAAGSGRFSTTTLGGPFLGLLGALGGPYTLFKGSPQMVELVGRAGEFTAWQRAYIVAIKLAALLVAGTAGNDVRNFKILTLWKVGKDDW